MLRMHDAREEVADAVLRVGEPGDEVGSESAGDGGDCFDGVDDGRDERAALEEGSVGVSYYRLRLVDGSCFGDSGGVAVSGGVTSEVGACGTIFAIGWSGLYSGAARR